MGSETSRASRRFAAVLGLATVLFGAVWLELVQDAWKDALHSYAVAIPLVSAWLVSQDRKVLVGVPLAPAWGSAMGLGLAAGLAWAAWFGARAAGVGAGWPLTLGMLGWVLAVWGGILGCFGWAWVGRMAFAVGFLVFTIPMPEPLVNAIEVGLQHSTAWLVEMALRALDVTYSRDARAFWLPGLRFQVAQECSGIRSTLVLFITSLVGGKLLLAGGKARGVLALAVIPLGIARNAFRICVLALLTIHVDPRIIHSPLHHQGGPLFFALSLVPLLLLFWWFRRREAAAERRSRGEPVTEVREKR
jgi:exosortase